MDPKRALKKYRVNNYFIGKREGKKATRLTPTTWGEVAVARFEAKALPEAMRDLAVDSLDIIEDNE